jgi:predicted nucleic acid-binding protein
LRERISTWSDPKIIRGQLIGGPNAGVKPWLETNDRKTQHVTVITLAEIQKDIELLAEGKRRIQLEEWLKQDLEAWFSGRILSVNRQVAGRYASLVARGMLLAFSPFVRVV